MTNRACLHEVDRKTCYYIEIGLGQVEWGDEQCYGDLYSSGLAALEPIDRPLFRDSIAAIVHG